MSGVQLKCRDSDDFSMRDILVYVALILLMPKTDYHIFRISNGVCLAAHMYLSNTCLEMSQQTQNVIDQSKIQQFMNKAVGDIAGSSTAMLVIIGERLGLYTAIAD